MVGSKASPEEVSMTYLRKIRKPMVEKKRRERMNQSINQLKDLIADTIKHNVAPMTRVDKADILELAVVHLSSAKRRKPQQGTTIATDTSGYSNGYKDCAREVIRFLSTNHMLDGHVIGDLSGHLQNSFTMKSRERLEHREPIRPEATYSTPIRPGYCVEMPNTLGQINEYSPIPQLSPDMSIYQTSSSSSGYSGFSSSSSNTTESLPSVSGFCEDYRQYPSDDLTSGKWGSGSSSGLVTIGDRNEDAIGHVIKDSVWRPW